MLLVICAKSLLIKSHTVKAHSDFVCLQMVPSHSKPQIAKWLHGFETVLLWAFFGVKCRKEKAK